MKIFEVWVVDHWSEIKTNAAGEAVYASNGGQVGDGMRITRVSNAPEPVNTAPTLADLTATGVLK